MLHYVDVLFQSYVYKGFKMMHIYPVQRDCLALYERGYVEDGVYIIRPVVGTDVYTCCDMSGGGWTVIQRRQDGLEDFYRTWDEYVAGFGHIIGEFWLGLENIYKLTQSSTSLRIEMKTFGDVAPVSAYADYSTFSIGNGAGNYLLHVDDFSGNCNDSFSQHDGYPFTTKDRDNDIYNDNCAIGYQSGWWYYNCHSSNLNGLYLHGNHSSYADGIMWYRCWGAHYSLQAVVMKIRRN